MQTHLIGEFKTYKWESEVWEETQMAQMISYGNQPRLLKQRNLEGKAVGGFYLAPWLWLTMFLFETPVLKWMPQQSKLRSGICIEKQ